MRDVSTNWLSPVASRARGTTNASDSLHVLVLRSRNAKELIEQRNKKSFLFHLAPCDSNGPLTTLLSAQKLFPLLLLQRCLVNNISTWLWSLVDGTQLTVSWDPEMSSLILCFCPFSPTRFIKQSPEKNISVIVTLSRPLKLQGLFWALKQEQIRFIRLVSDPSLAQQGFPEET